jgi:hypothetical protein
MFVHPVLRVCIKIITAVTPFCDFVPVARKSVTTITRAYYYCQTIANYAAFARQLMTIFAGNYFREPCIALRGIQKVR